jgi:hypothetical protein
LLQAPAEPDQCSLDRGRIWLVTNQLTRYKLQQTASTAVVQTGKGVGWKSISYPVTSSSSQLDQLFARQVTETAGNKSVNLLQALADSLISCSLDR